ncbi:MAG: hypothetical protein LQ340_003075 [Diploschistes diacapsis]|nr:MAG: hypothetical protein LQ340_003075 [Diploschistes diacapsis]
MVMASTSAFLRFWWEGKTRETFLSCLPKEDLASLRLACQDFGMRAAPHLFKEMTITFRHNAFTKPARMAALYRVGIYVQSLTFRMVHSQETFLPPLLDPITGEEIEFVYEPYCQVDRNTNDRLSIPTYGSWEMTDLLVKQYPPLFHAAANVPSFIHLFRSLPNVNHLTVSTPGQDASQRYRRSVVDYALISLRIAVERAPLRHLSSLALLNIHASAVHYLNPTMGLGALPNSARRWRQIRNLTIYMDTIPHDPCLRNPIDTGTDHLKLLHAYLQTFASTLERLTFHWYGPKGLFPLALSSEQCLLPPSPGLACPRRCHLALRPLKFEKLVFMEVDNVTTSASQVSSFILAHRRSISEFNFEGTTLREGTWDDALAPLTRMSGSETWKGKAREVMDVPLVFSSPVEDLQSPAEKEAKRREWRKRQEREREKERQRCPTPLLSSLGGMWGLGKPSDYAWSCESPAVGRANGTLREQISRLLRPARVGWR